MQVGEMPRRVDQIPHDQHEQALESQIKHEEAFVREADPHAVIATCCDSIADIQQEGAFMGLAEAMPGEGMPDVQGEMLLEPENQCRPAVELIRAIALV